VRAGLAAVALVAVLWTIGCAQTREAHSIASEGFLSEREWALMQKNENPPPELEYINRSVDWTQYQGVMVDSVSLWKSTDKEKISPEDQQTILDYFYAALHRELSQVGNVVDRPGPGIARLRIAITDAQGANVPGRVATTLVPQLRILTSAGGLVSDASVTVGEAGIEAKLTDSMTDRLLACAADRRIGQKSFKGMTDKWSDIKAAIDLWTKSFVEVWVEQRGVIRAG
jgi:hypothetical protein